MLSTSENFAIHLALVFSLTAQRAAEMTGASSKTIEDAMLKILPKIRGRMIAYDEYLAPNPRPNRDAFRLDKEVQLAQLQHQHDECLSAWATSVNHARLLFEQHNKLASPDSEPPKKPFVGDIRFLQLAKHIRREMEKIEHAIAKHSQELADQGATSKAEESTPSVNNASLELQLPNVKADSNETFKNRDTASKPLPAVTAARVATVQSLMETMPTSASQPFQKRREIPTIEQPPRKKDKYAGVNR